MSKRAQQKSAQEINRIVVSKIPYHTTHPMIDAYIEIRNASDIVFDPAQIQVERDWVWLAFVDSYTNKAQNQEHLLTAVLSVLDKATAHWNVPKTFLSSFPTGGVEWRRDAFHSRTFSDQRGIVASAVLEDLNRIPSISSSLVEQLVEAWKLPADTVEEPADEPEPETPDPKQSEKPAAKPAAARAETAKPSADIKTGTGGSKPA